MRFQYWKSSHDKLWYWRLRGANGETMCTSEGYHNLTDALDTIKLIKGLRTYFAVVEKIEEA